MDQPAPTRNPATVLRNLAFLALLVAISAAFFWWVRDNTFWHSGDYAYLMHALRIDGDWRQIFAADPHETFQPLVNLVFYLEFKLFGLEAWGYYLSNIVLHAFNAWLVYALVHHLLKEKRIAVLSAVLFVAAVGNYGKAVMVVSGVGDLVITALTLLTMYFYIRNELDDRGRLRALNFVLCLLFFFLSLLSKATSFSILGCMVAFNLFFREQTGRRVFDTNFMIIAGFALVVLVVKLSVLRTIPAAADIDLSWSLPKNFASYLVRMVFPIHFSSIVRDAGVVVKTIYKLATEIRALIFLCIVSYSVFGFIFGNKVIRFFIAWTYITVAPFCLFRFPADWLNIRYLYLVSVGFNMILASGTVLAARLLAETTWRRFLPYVIPLFFILLSQFVISHLDASYETQAMEPRMESVRASFEASYEERYGTRP